MCGCYSVPWRLRLGRQSQVSCLVSLPLEAAILSTLVLPNDADTITNLNLLQGLQQL